MSGKSVIEGASLSDIYTRIIPGFVLFFPIILTAFIGSELDLGLLLEPAAIVLILISSLIAGEFLNNSRKLLSGAPRHFGRIIYEGENVRLLHFRDRIRTEDGRKIHSKLTKPFGWVAEKLIGPPKVADAPVFHENGVYFREVLSNHLSIDIDKTPVDKTYYMFISHIGNEFPLETKRRHQLYIMNTNLKIGYTLSFVLTLIFLPLIFVDGFVMSMISRSAMVVYVAIIWSLFPVYILPKFYLIDMDENFIEACITEYYYDRFAKDTTPDQVTETYVKSDPDCIETP